MDPERTSAREPVRAVRGRLEADAVVVRHGGTRVLDGVTLALGRGELVALVGPNGSGKSTLLRVLAGAQPYDEGTVRLDGALLGPMSPRARARALTIVTHAQPPDFALRVRDVVALGRIPYESYLGRAGPADTAAVRAALAVTGVEPLADRTLGTLSSGELQRVHLARAFAQGVSVLLLDEPTANLDPKHQLVAMRLVRAFVERGGAALVVLHDLTLAARHCDRVLVLEQGRLRADAPPSEALAEELLAEVFCVRSRVHRGAQGEVDHVLALEPIEPRTPEGGEG
jgi:iron complex transport system ATP-binding protein